ncbi:hypothetical protein [Jannaschia pohangensis]|uniref:Uncharacterized protein n=1 Tax=Jannaschia pohangensis TaxID=390807 RepID=A0A1I3GDI8_9RHOB|nr:hypothetical protein [Jannaschia pohangensis]SFI21585.1 hypothetical protein SAMN04488095_0156 [Jannaschia pohangensis]
MAKEGQGPDDPKALIAEAYRIEGITEAECRIIFLDWALSLPGDVIATIPRVMEGKPEDHPMTSVLRDGLVRPARTGRRGGWSARHPDGD